VWRISVPAHCRDRVRSCVPFQKKKKKLQAEARGLRVWGQPALHSETLSQKIIHDKKEEKYIFFMLKKNPDTFSVLQFFGGILSAACARWERFSYIILQDLYLRQACPGTLLCQSIKNEAKWLCHWLTPIILAIQEAESGDRDQEDWGSKPDQANNSKFERAYLKKNPSQKTGWQSDLRVRALTQKCEPWVQTTVLPKKEAK
jgi:hypothetical protein